MLLDEVLLPNDKATFSTAPNLFNFTLIYMYLFFPQENSVLLFYVNRNGPFKLWLL